MQFIDIGKMMGELATLAVFFYGWPYLLTLMFVVALFNRPRSHRFFGDK